MKTEKSEKSNRSQIMLKKKEWLMSNATLMSKR